MENPLLLLFLIGFILGFCFGLFFGNKRFRKMVLGMLKTRNDDEEDEDREDDDRHDRYDDRNKTYRDGRYRSDDRARR